MSLALSLLAFLLLTAGTALFVAAEFSLTALERSTVCLLYTSDAADE